MSAEIYIAPRSERAHQGSDELTVWCPRCAERTIPGRGGCCMWCDEPLTDVARALHEERLLRAPSAVEVRPGE
jgi:hypothetical protein